VDAGGGVVGDGGQPEVGDDQAPVERPQQVPQRDVAVNDAGCVNRGQARRDRARVGDARVGGARLQHARVHLGAQRARRQLHHQEDVPVGLFEVEDAADVRMFSCRASFTSWARRSAQRRSQASPAAAP